MKKLLVASLLLVGLSSVSFGKFEEKFGALPIVETGDDSFRADTFESKDGHKMAVIMFDRSSEADKTFSETMQTLNGNEYEIIGYSEMLGVKNVKYKYDGFIVSFTQNSEEVHILKIKESKISSAEKFGTYLKLNNVPEPVAWEISAIIMENAFN